MAESASESSPQPDAFGLRKISSSLFSVPSFVIGFSTKSSSDPDSVRSPTSPLDFKVFANLSNPFSGKAPTSPSQNGYQKKWDYNKVGLRIINSLVSDPKPNDQILDSLKRKNIVFGPQVKINFSNSSKHYESLDYPRKSNSLPKNYTISPLSQTKTPISKLSSSNCVLRNEGVLLELELDSTAPSSSPTRSIQDPCLSSKKFCSEDRTILTSSPLAISGGSQVDNSLLIKSSSLPIPIASACVGSLSAREIELSEDYTCIISHGPNPKTTHIFGDYILDGHAHELANFDEKKEQGTKPTQVAKHKEDSIPYPSDKFLSFCHTCKKKLEKGDDIYMYRGEKAFCSFDCRSEEIFAEEETEKTFNNSSKGSPESSYHEDLFLMGMPIV